MNAGPKFTKVHRQTKMDFIVSKVLAPIALLGGLLLLFFATLNPFTFSFQSLSLAEYLGSFQFVPSSYLDFPLNILLFLPIGFGLAALLDRIRFSKRATFISVFLTGLLLTWFVESMQHFLPGRTPNFSDILANVLGALLGLALFRIWQNRRNFLGAILKPQYLALCLMISLLLISGLGIVLRERARFDNWRPRFGLLIGNENTGDRPWVGNVTDLAFLDRALLRSDVQDCFLNDKSIDFAGDSLVAYYPLQDSESLADQTGNLWDLYWMNESGKSPAVETHQLDGRNWLRSEWAVIYLAERLVATSQFTIMLSVSTGDLQQTGPARIISVSATPYYRNLTLAQEGHDLIVRVRTPQTGLNGTLPELLFPDVFVDKEPQKLIVTYDGLILTKYIDDEARAIPLQIVPGLAFFYSLYAPFRHTLTVNPTISIVYMALFYLLFFIPVGFLLALLAAQLHRPILRLSLLIAGITIPAVLLELFLTAKNGYQLRPTNVLLAVVVTALSFLLLTPAAGKLLRLRGTPQTEHRPYSNDGTNREN